MDNSSTKKVNVSIDRILYLSKPLIGIEKNIILTIEEIRTCLDNGATVDEVLNNGSTIRLNYTNYSKNNNNSLPKINKVLKEDNQDHNISDILNKRKLRSKIKNINNKIIKEENQKALMNLLNIK